MDNFILLVCDNIKGMVIGSILERKVITLIQRVSQAYVMIENSIYSKIDVGLLALVCFEPDDTESIVDKRLTRLINYRIFPDAEGKMNRSLKDIDGALMLVPQFTLGADTRKGNRPSFSSVADPGLGQQLFLYMATAARTQFSKVETGVFGANMAVGLVNDGPVTFWFR